MGRWLTTPTPSLPLASSTLTTLVYTRRDADERDGGCDGTRNISRVHQSRFNYLS